MAKKYSITSKHQVTLPTEVREALALDRHDQVEFVVSDDGQVTIRKSMTLDDLRQKMHAKYIAGRDRPATDEEIVNARDTFYKTGQQW